MWKADAGLAVLAGTVAIYTLVHSTGLQYLVRFSPGPGFAPFWLSLALLALSIWLLAISLIRRGTERGFPIGRTEGVRATAVFVALGMAVLLLERAGFVVSMTFFMAVILKFLEGRGWVFSLGVGAVASTLVFFLFAVLFDVPLPRLVDGLI